MIVAARGLGLHGRLEPIDLTLAAGTLTCLVGPNGSGKSSLLHALAGICRPAGSVRIAGVNPHAAPPAQRQRLLTYLPTSREIAWPLVAADLVRLGADVSGEEIAPVLAALELSELQHRRTDRLSTGERSRVLIARALAPKPRLLLLDEPVSNLDPLWQLKLLDFIRTEARSNDQAVLLAIHDLDLAARYGDRLIVMRERRIVADGPPQTILSGPAVRDVFGIVRAERGWAPA